MDLMIRAFLKSFSAIFVPGLFWVFIQSFILTLIALLLFVGGVSWVFQATVFSWFGQWDFLVDIGASLGAGILAWFLFPVVMLAIIGLYYERIAELIEENDYPNVKKPAPRPFWPDMVEDILFALKALALNVIVLPVYLITAIFGIGFVIYYLLNGYLFGCEFFDNVAARHEGKKQAKAVRNKNRIPVILGGIAIAIGGTIPIINLFVPFFGIATMVHFYRIIQQDEQRYVIS